MTEQELNGIAARVKELKTRTWLSADQLLLIALWDHYQQLAVRHVELDLAPPLTVFKKTNEGTIIRPLSTAHPDNANLAPPTSEMLELAKRVLERPKPTEEAIRQGGVRFICDSRLGEES